MDPSPGLKVGHYELLARLGEGGMGEVWRALDLSLHREVAVKFIARGALEHPHRLARFQREARAASALNHPNIVTIHEIGQSEDRPYMVLELVHGRSLRELMASGRLPMAKALDVACQAADGLARAHGAGIIHRDLKPDNVMVTDDGLVKLLDFGLAKLVTPVGTERARVDESAPTEVVLGADEPTVSKTHDGVVMGTVGYMSPEQARGREIDHRSDQFALGSILYEMLSGHRAFQKSSTVETLMAIIGEEPEQPAPEVPAPLRWILDRLLAKDPDHRYASTLDLARELRNVSVHLGELRSAPRPPLPGPRRRVPARALVAAATIATAGVLLSPARDRLAALLGGSSGPPQSGHVAVLPFKYVGVNPQGQLICEGLVDILNSKLTQLEQFQGALTVVPASEVVSSRITTPSAARRQFGATLVITGTVQESAGRVRAQASLVEADSLRQVRSVEVEESAGELFRLQDRLLERLVDMLRLRADAGAQNVLAAGETALGDAYGDYVRARGLLQRRDKPENLAAAIALLKQAVQRDPRYALAHAALCEAYWLQYVATRQTDSVALARASCQAATALEQRLPAVFVTLAMLERGTGQAREALVQADRALALDPLNADAHRERARALLDLREFERAEEAYRKATALRPQDWSVHQQLGRFLYARGRHAEARQAFARVTELAPDNVLGWNNLGSAAFAQDELEEARRAWEASLAIAPNATAASNLGTLAFFQGRYAEAARLFQEALKTRPSDNRLWANLGAALYWAPGMREQARAAYEQAVELAEQERQVNPRDGNLHARIATSLAMLGRGREAKAAIAEALAAAPQDAHVMFAAALVHEQLGDRDGALRWVSSAMAAGYPARELAATPLLSRLRDDPRFKSAVPAPSPKAPPKASARQPEPPPGRRATPALTA
jgi:serine/threonine protein kinase/Flp pilus assembly protein TadD